MQTSDSLPPYTKINSKWVKGLNIRQDTMKLLEEITGKTCSDINLRSRPMQSKAREIKVKVNKWETNKGKESTREASAPEKGTLNKTEGPPTDREKMGAKGVPNKGSVNKITNSSKDSVTERQTAQLKNGQKT